MFAKSGWDVTGHIDLNPLNLIIVFGLVFFNFVLSKFIGDDEETENGYAVHELKRICCRTSFYMYWRINHSNVKIQKPLDDICSTCFKFNLYYRWWVKKKKKTEEDTE